MRKASQETAVPGTPERTSLEFKSPDLSALHQQSLPYLCITGASWFGVGLLISLAIGAALIAVWFTEATDLWQKSEELWEGSLSLLTSTLIFFVGITMLKMGESTRKAKWRTKLHDTCEGKGSSLDSRIHTIAIDNRTRTGKWAFFVLSLITILREGIEAVVFVGGVSLSQPATSIPLATIVGITQCCASQRQRQSH